MASYGPYYLIRHFEHTTAVVPEVGCLKEGPRVPQDLFISFFYYKLLIMFHHTEATHRVTLLN